MKRLIFFLGFIGAFLIGYGQPGAPNQTVTISDGKTQSIILNTLDVRGQFKPPVRDTNFTAISWGVFVVRPADTLLYMSTGQTSGQKWKLIGSSNAGATWGTNISGNISNQVDLQLEFATKQNILPVGLISEYWDATGAKRTFPTIPAQMNLSVPAGGNLILGGTYPNVTITNGITNLSQLNNGPGFISQNDLITLSGAVNGSGRTTIPVTLAAVVTPDTCTVCSLRFNAAGQIQFYSNGSATTPVPSVFGRTGAIVATTGDYTAAQVTNAVSTISTYANPTWITQLGWTKIISTPITIAGYGITDNLVNTFNTRTGTVTLTSGDVTTALGFTPVTNARTLTINGTTFDLTSNRTWTITGTGFTFADTGYTHSIPSLLTLRKVVDSQAVVSLVTYLSKAQNLNDLPSVSTARSNLGLGSAAQQSTGFFAQTGNNLSDLSSAPTARINLGIVGGTPGNLTYLTANGSLYTTPIIFDTTQNNLKVNYPMFSIGGSSPSGARVQWVFNNSDFGLGIQVAGTSTSKFLGFSNSISSNVGIYNEIFNGDAGNSAHAIEQMRSHGQGDAGIVMVQEQGLSSGIGINGYQFKMKRVAANQARLQMSWGTYANIQAGIEFVMGQWDSLGRWYMTPTPRVGITTDDIVVRSTAGELKTVPQASIFGAGTFNRFAPIDSTARNSNGIWSSGNTIIPQTADATHPGFISGISQAFLDSVRNRIYKTAINIGHVGVGTWTGYATPDGSAVNFKNIQGTGIIIAAQNDSSLLFTPDYSLVAGLTNTQNLTNKTLTSPIVSVGSDVTGDMYYRSGGGQLTRIPIGTARQGLRVVGGFPVWIDSSAGAGSVNLIASSNATTNTVSAGGTPAVLNSATHSLAGLLTAANQTRLDSTVYLRRTGHGVSTIRVPWTLDTLWFKGIGITATHGLVATNTSTIDSVGFNIDFAPFIAQGDMLIGGVAGVPNVVPIGSNTFVWTSNGTTGSWVAPASGSVTSWNATGTTTPLFTYNITNATTTPAIAFTLSNAPAFTMLMNNTASSAAYSFGKPTLNGGIFANQGATNFTLHGNAAGNPSWAAVNLNNEVTGILQAQQMPSLTGPVTTTNGSLVTSITNLSLTNAMIANSTINLTTKVTGILPAANGGTGVANTGTVTLGGNFATSGAFGVTLTATALTNATLPPGTTTLLASNGSGAALTNIVQALVGTANEIIVTPSGTSYTIATPQPLAPTSSPTFTGLTTTGLPGGGGTDLLVTQLNNSTQLRVTPFSTFLTSNNITSGQWVPTITNIANVASSAPSIAYYQRIGNTVSGDVYFTATHTSGNTVCTVTFSLPIPSNFVNATDATGSGTTGIPSVGGLQAQAIGSTQTFQAQWIPTGAGQSSNYAFHYSYNVR